MTGLEREERLSDMGLLNKFAQYWNRFRLMINSGYYTEYLMKQGVKIGKDSIVIYPSYIDARLPYLVEIGNNVTVSRNVTILAHDATTAYAGDMVKIGRVTIHDHCFIGANSTILCNISIGPNSIVGAGSVVTRNVLPDTVYAGNPARQVSTVKEFIEKVRKDKEQFPFFEGKDYQNPYIPESRKDIIKDKLSKKHGYFCSRLPED